MREEMERRFGDAASISYVDATDEEAAASHSDILSAIRTEGLLFPVTVVDGSPVYDGAVSYPAILRAVEAKLAGTTA